MKNHLSTLPSIGAGGRFSPLGMLASWAGSTRSVELDTVTLALDDELAYSSQKTKSKNELSLTG